MTKMDLQTIFKFVTEHGLMPVLFIIAFYHIITESKNREKAQRELYEKLSEDVEEISKAVSVVEESIKRTDQNVANSANTANDVSKEVTHLKYMISSLETIIKSYMK